VRPRGQSIGCRGHGRVYVFSGHSSTALSQDRTPSPVAAYREVDVTPQQIQSTYQIETF
jgi:hypothetical protein